MHPMRALVYLLIASASVFFLAALLAWIQTAVTTHNREFDRADNNRRAARALTYAGTLTAALSLLAYGFLTHAQP